MQDKEALYRKIIHSKQYIRKWEIYLLVFAVGSLTWLFSWALYRLGLENILARYPLAIVFSWLVFVPLFYLLLRLWLRRIQRLYESRSQAGAKSFSNLDEIGDINVFDGLDLEGVVIAIVLFVALFGITLFVNLIPGFVEELLVTEFAVLFFTKRLLAVNEDFDMKLVFRHTAKVYAIILFLVTLAAFILFCLFPEQHTLRQMVMKVLSPAQ
jgi:hypothetical protein